MRRAEHIGIGELPRPPQLAGAVVDREDRVGARTRGWCEALTGADEQQSTLGIDGWCRPHADTRPGASIVRRCIELPTEPASDCVVRALRASEGVALLVDHVLEARDAL